VMASVWWFPFFPVSEFLVFCFYFYIPIQRERCLYDGRDTDCFLGVSRRRIVASFPKFLRARSFFPVSWTAPSTQMAPSFLTSSAPCTFGLTVFATIPPIRKLHRVGLRSCAAFWQYPPLSALSSLPKLFSPPVCLSPPPSDKVLRTHCFFSRSIFSPILNGPPLFSSNSIDT